MRLWLTKLSVVWFVVFAVCVPLQIAHADVGPKPSMTFEFTGDPAGRTVESDVLYECDDEECSDAAPLQEVGPQGLHCDISACRSVKYGEYKPHLVLEVRFSDRVTLRSNVFEPQGFESEYRVTVEPDGLLVEPTSVTQGNNALLLLAGVLAIAATAGIVTWLMILRRSKSRD